MIKYQDASDSTGSIININDVTPADRVSTQFFVLVVIQKCHPFSVRKSNIILGIRKIVNVIRKLICISLGKDIDKAYVTDIIQFI